MFSQGSLVIRSSRYLLAACILLHLLLAIAMLSTGPIWWLATVYSLLLIVHCNWWLWHDILLRGRFSPVALRWTKAGFSLELAGQRCLQAWLLPHSFISPYLMVLHFRVLGWPIGRPLILILAPDSGDRCQQRRLRVFTRCGDSCSKQIASPGLTINVAVEPKESLQHYSSR
jgi:hypothetical protein